MEFRWFKDESPPSREGQQTLSKIKIQIDFPLILYFKIYFKLPFHPGIPWKEVNLGARGCCRETRSENIPGVPPHPCQEQDLNLKTLII